MGITFVDVEVASVADPDRTEVVHCLVDSGATYSVVPTEVLARLGIRPCSEERMILAKWETIVRPRGGAIFKYQNRIGVSDVLFGEPGDENLLGVLTLESMGLVLDPLKRELRNLRLLLAWLDSMADANSVLRDFRRSAESFCSEIESYQAKPEADFLLEISSILANLYSSGIKLVPRLPDPQTDDFEIATDSQLWGRVSSMIEPYLVRTDQYRKILSAYPDGDDDDHTIEGCLANDLASIYVYLIGALKLPMGTFELMAINFVKQVGEEAVDALTAVHYALYEDFRFEEDE